MTSTRILMEHDEINGFLKTFRLQNNSDCPFPGCRSWYVEMRIFCSWRRHFVVNPPVIPNSIVLGYGYVAWPQESENHVVKNANRRGVRVKGHGEHFSK